MRKLTVADYFIEFLIENGIKDVFGYQGGMIAYIFDSLGKYKDKIKFHHCCNEQGAAIAACAYATATKNFTMCFTTSGPGFTNTITGIANAYYDSIPVIFVSGQVNTKDINHNKNLRQLGFQEMPSTELVKKITKKTYAIDLNTNIKECLDDAVKTVMHNRKGPVYIELPINVCRETVEFDSISRIQTANIEMQENKFEFDFSKLFEDINSSVRPVIIAGAGIKQSNSEDLFKELISVLNVPVVFTMPAIDIIDDANELKISYIGGTGRREGGLILKNADLVLTIGTRLCSKQLGHTLANFAPNAKKVYRVDIDSAEFERKITEKEIDILMNINCFIRSLLDVAKSSKDSVINHTSWISICNEVKSIFKTIDLTYGNKMMEYITELLPNDSNVIFDVGNNLVYGAQSVVIKKGTMIFGSFGLGAMGYSIPASIGAYYGNKKPTYSFSGDGGAQMNIQEINTIAKNKLPVKLFILNNRTLEHIIVFQKNYLDNRIIATNEQNGDYFSCDFYKLAEAYGIRGIKLNDYKEIDNYIKELNDDTPTIFDINFNDTSYLPQVLAGGDFLHTGPKLDEEVVTKVERLFK